ncbi:MAG: aryl-alcohol dehydrogenase-like predicted oxidoreductase, partial [Saprospiraceae bacterium]
MQYIGLGTAALGRPQYINIKKEKVESFSLEALKQKAWDMLDNAFEQGVRYFDTAPGYGMAEQVLIDWVNKKGDDSIEIATKWGYTYVADFNPDAAQHEVKEHSVEKLNGQWEQSIKLLPNLSTYQIHSATLETGVLENKAVLNRLAELKQEHGLKMGISTTGDNQVEVLKKALAVKANGLELFDAFQVTYNILDQSLAEVMPLLDSLGKRVIIKEALANGRLFPNDNYPHYSALYVLLKRLSEKYRVGIDAIGLRFCIDSIHPFMVLSGASVLPHLSDNLKAMNFQLEADEVQQLKSFGVKP